MKTLILTDNETDIKTAAQLLKQGKLVAIPTETVYGLAADALNGKAVANIFKAKGRPMDNPLIVHISSIDEIQRYGLTEEFPETARKLADAFWPGPLTMIMKKSRVIPPEVSCGLDTVAIRYPASRIAQQIIATAQRPLAAPSANRSGSPSPTSAQHVTDDLDGRIDAVVDGGICDIGLESTVITLAEHPPRLLRPGGITLEQLEAVLGTVTVDRAVLENMDKNSKPASPGMKYKHYSPKADVILLDGTDEQFINYVNQHAGSGTVCLCYNGDEAKLRVPAICLGGRTDYDQQAHNLFSALRRIDTMKHITTVYARCPQTQGIGMAVYNRLIRAAGFEVKQLAQS